jgi:hypothetical protein
MGLCPNVGTDPRDLFYDVSAGVTAYVAWLKANHK